ncbi:oligosaccharide flippase family protein [Shewanella pneumatophori]|uniref:Oligosaccharide flippase family protein n=1 Tax=Shewanella pneumatophori TaxID=314092 RepID=A0A9X1ZGK0_9GAMM|nr:oligosaccharide flippase family protein [Shewanella pneumatophori]MCL1139545.1 oligosaccharide flippase family protein [Shewanella pneumatophori]
MQSLMQYQHALTTSFSSALGKSLFWLGSAQVLGRIVRLASSIIIARLLTPEIFGQVAIILTCFEIICTPTRRISSAALIKMDDEQLKHSLHAASQVNWLAAIIAFVAMSLLSWPLAIYFDDMQLILPMILMATSYLLLPLGMLYAAINLRANKMRIVGRAVLWQTLFDGLLTATFALLGLGIWAIILPKIIVIFIWIGVHRYRNPLPETLSNAKALSDAKPLDSMPLQPAQSEPVSTTSENATSNKRLSTAVWYKRLLPSVNLFTLLISPRARAILSFGFQVGLSDLAIVLRQNIDYILVGYFLGIEALGVYFFAFNASLGISLGLVQSYGTALYSHLCQSSNKQNQAQALKTHEPANKSSDTQQKYVQSLKFIMLLTLPIIGIQALFAPIYVPFVYGQKWLDAGALPIFILLCLSGLVRPLGEAASQYLISIGKSQFNLACNSAFTLVLIMSISLASQFGLQAVALSVLLVHLALMPALTLYLHSTFTTLSKPNH